MHTYDLIGIGIGPFNLGLACLTDPIDELDGLFLDAKPEFAWHPGMLLDGTTLQTPFMSDLVTLADPTSPFSFLNYLKQIGRLYPFYIRKNFYPLRAEFDDYCRWAAGQLDCLRFAQRAMRIEYDGSYHVTTDRDTFRARRLVLGVGTEPHLPPSCRNLGGDAFHNSSYIANKPALQGKRSITVVGSGQSAAEIYYDLLQDIDRCGYDLTWVTRSPRFFPLEYTKLTLEMASPDYVDYFHALPPDRRGRLVATQKALYKGINASLIDDIFDLLYEKSRRGPCATRLLTNTAVTGADYDADRGYTLTLHHEEQDATTTHSTDGLVFATGYHYRTPDFLRPIAHRIRWDGNGRFDVRRDYSIDLAGNEIYVQNAELHTHGFVAPDLGMAAYRNSCIIRELLGREHYPIEKSIAFQDFGA